MSDHFLMETRMKVVGGWRSTRSLEGVINVLKVSELNKSRKRISVCMTGILRELAWKICSVERWGCWECGVGVGKVQRYSKGVNQ